MDSEPDSERRAITPDIADAVEDAIDDKREGDLAADATGMIRNEEFITVTELREGEVTPPA
jgi:hypothetical protein